VLGLSGLYPIVPVVQLLLVTHVAIGLLEAALTGAVLATVVRWPPGPRPRPVGRGVGSLGRGRGRRTPRRRHRGGGVSLAVRVGAAGWPRSCRRAARVRGPCGRLLPAPFPDYALPFLSSPAIATAAAGVAGTLLAAAVAWGVSRGVRQPGRDAHR